LNVKLVDENFPADKFEYVTGFNQVKWAKLSPSSNVSHVAVVRPKIVGPFNLTHATVTYFPNEKATKAQVCFLLCLSFNLLINVMNLKDRLFN
jgi:translocon-associated protein subunit beta